MMKLTLPIDTYETRLITWKGDVGIVEASDLKSFRLRRVWNDSLDMGCYFKSHRTGRLVLFTVVEHEVNNEGELTEWKLASYGLTDPVIITVLND